MKLRAEDEEGIEGVRIALGILRDSYGTTEKAHPSAERRMIRCIAEGH